VVSGGSRQIWDGQNLVANSGGDIFTVEPLLYGNLISQRPH